jgi:hypothetical protein
VSDIFIICIIHRLQIILKKAFRAFGKCPISFIGPPFIKAVSMDPFTSTLAFAGSNHGFWGIFFQTNATCHGIVMILSRSCGV